MRYRVIAPLVIAHDQVGQAHHKYAGEVIPWLSQEQTEHLLDMGMVEELAAPAAAPAPAPAPAPVATGDPGGTQQAPPEAVTTGAASRPLQAAPKEVWVEYAVSRGVDRAAAEAMTKADLQALGAD
ncbi:hypothetical protein [Nocardia pseudovaccinii]|uniref:hypothetical protein n=1 Tax=Nocardia pseudovaccinii TaxID=189540 RepID=UPI0007A4F752|nr:hypothetical protein [Nocardia pseudovaccinii]